MTNAVLMHLEGPPSCWARRPAACKPKSRKASGARRFLGRAWPLALLALALSGCERDPKTDAPTKPWRAGEREPDEIQISPVRYELVDSKLRFEAGGKKADIVGRLPHVEGFIEVDPKSLERVRGKLRLDLRRLTIDEHSASTTTGSEGDPSESPGLWAGAATPEARRWFGLGAGVPDKEAAKNARASFDIRSAKLLTHTMAHRGAPSKADALPWPISGDPQVRRIRGTVVGELLVRGFAVQHSLRVDLHFVYPEKVRADSPPSALQVSLVGTERVPLVEHDIRPRDDEGIVRADAAELIGPEVAPAARVEGHLRFRLAADPGRGSGR